MAKAFLANLKKGALKKKGGVKPGSKFIFGKKLKGKKAMSDEDKLGVVNS